MSTLIEDSIAEFDFEQARYDDFSETFQLTDEDDTPIDLSTYTFKAELRESQNRTATLIVGFTIDDTDKATGTIVLTLTDAQTGVVTVDEGYYSILYTDGSAIDKTYFKGKITFTDCATQK